MSPKQKMITATWCSMTMITTMIVSHGHLIMKEIMTHWPTEDSWEGRLETAMYTQGGLFFAASFVVGVTILVRGFFSKAKDEQISRRELSQREKHERAAAQRHDALMASLTKLAGGGESKKPHASGARPR
ncbi:MAG: hypothetical protein ACR2NZ_09635 [Rubripirellula sp.]